MGSGKPTVKYAEIISMGNYFSEEIPKFNCNREEKFVALSRFCILRSENYLAWKDYVPVSIWDAKDSFRKLTFRDR